MERENSVLQCKLLKCGRLDNQNYITDEDISKFITYERECNRTDVANQLQAYFNMMKKRRESNDIDKKMPYKEFKDTK